MYLDFFDKGQNWPPATKRTLKDISRSTYPKKTYEGLKCSYNCPIFKCKILISYEYSNVTNFSFFCDLDFLKRPQLSIFYSKWLDFGYVIEDIKLLWAFSFRVKRPIFNRVFREKPIFPRWRIVAPKKEIDKKFQIGKKEHIKYYL